MTPALALLPLPDPRGLGGLVALVNGVEQALPLRSVRVRARIVGDACRMEIDQRYSNPYASALDAVHLFPLPRDGAVVEMELHAGETRLRMECREREAAVAITQAAGQPRPRLLAERADLHALRVAHLPAGTDVHVRMVVIERLAAVDGRMQWRFPTTIGARFLGSSALDSTPDAPSGDTRLQPPLALAGGAQLDIEVQVCGGVRTIATSIPVVRVALADGGTRLAPRGNATVGTEFLLHLTTNVLDRVDARAYSDGTHTLVVVEPPGAALLAPLPRDVVFVIDLSAPIGGSIGAVKRAVCSALHGLLAQDRFQVIAFHVGPLLRFRPAFVPCEEATVKAADAWVDALELGGAGGRLPATQVSAIQTAFDDEPPSDRLPTGFWLTSGPSDADSGGVVAVGERGGFARTFDIDDGFEAVFAGFEAEVGTPIARGVTIAGGALAGPSERVLFAGRPVTAFLLGSPGTVRISGRTVGAALDVEVAPTPVDFPLGAHWARERVEQLEDRLTLRPSEEGVLRAEIQRIALEHRIASRYTTLVSVETNAQTPGERVSLLQPGLLPVVLRGAADPFADSSGALARTQGVDGSFGADIHRTAAALLTLVLLANTRHAGARKRVVLKAAAWLGAHSAEPHASVALAALNRVERGDDAGRKHELRILADNSSEGRILGELLAVRFPR